MRSQLIPRLILLLTLAAAWPAAGAAASAVDYGPAGVLILKGLPPCLAEGLASAYDRCLRPHAKIDAPADVRAQAAVERAVVLIYLRRWDEARHELDAAVAANPASMEARHLAARLAITAYQERHEARWLAAAELHTAAAVALAPNDPDVRATAAFLIYVKGHDEDAIAAYGAALALDPRHAYSLGQRAMLHAAKGRLVVALKDYNEAVAAAPNDARLRLERARLLAELGQPGAALDDLDAVIAHDRYAFLAYVVRAGIHRRLGNLEAALEDLTTLVLGPKDGMPFATGGDQLSGFMMQRALVLSDLRRHAEAADEMLRAVKLGGKQKILRLQVYLRQHGQGSVPLDGVASDALISALELCFRNAACRSGLSRHA